jgi:hypothetical protein
MSNINLLSLRQDIDKFINNSRQAEEENYQSGKFHLAGIVYITIWDKKIAKQLIKFGFDLRKETYPKVHYTLVHYCSNGALDEAEGYANEFARKYDFLSTRVWLD